MLGSLDVVVDGRSVQIGGPKPRALLAVLAARGGAVVSVDALADALWEGSPPGQPGRSVQVYVSAVRKALGVREVALRSVPGGYRLDLAADDNLRTALGWLDDRPATDRDSRETRLRLAAALSGFWYRTGRATEGSRWLEKALAGSDDLPDLLRGRTLHGLGILQSMRNQAEQARSTFVASGEIFRRLGELGQLARSLNSQGGVARDQGEPAEARRLLEESLALWRSVGDRSRIGLVLGNLGLVARDEMDLPRARALLEEGLAIDAEHNNVWGAASKLLSLAIVALDEGDLGAARDLLVRCSAQYAELGERHGLTEAVDVAAWIAAATGDHPRAARLGGAAEAERFELGILLGPNDIGLAERHLHPARAALGERGFEAAWADGQRLGFHEALAEAGLTGREVLVDHSAGSLPPSLAR